ncbi:quinone oxidoreductase pig3-related [Anaeramoeba flamelloides]|uniref:Quinone oxidoreductase pig3-related n=1 Tax=Anaeramoeba flamelloides TaxID=1746091 RepID=A0AAV7Z4A4_9EUKA|nr:quinone oxidoreductase pig3-related [Anaeramoeba flamelloides]|eukprot:Anaeramoba_flamelloidesa810332_691.p1 GENE.a810332_691~~a810332_691.p1  ORF type:complete len:321 (-),score=91.60 a810332_691:189-1151(-)
MKAITVSEYGNPDVLKYTTVDKPVLKEGEVLIKNKFAGINYADILLRKGLWPSTLPLNLGYEGSGTIEEIYQGTTTDFKVGDKVCYFAQSGGYAEYIAIPAMNLITIPEGITYEQAASIPVIGVTAYMLTHLAYQLKEGDWCLIHGGAGAVNSMAIQMAKIVGATVITTVSTEKKAKIVKELGADHIIMYTQEDFVEKVLALRPNGVDLVIDGVGKTTFKGSIKVVKKRGTFLNYGGASGFPEPFMPFDLKNSINFCFPSMFDFATEKGFAPYLDTCFKWILAGKLKIQQGSIKPLSKANELHSEIEGRKSLGKLLLQMD